MTTVALSTASNAHPTFADLLRPRSAAARAGLYDLGLVVAASLFVAVCAQIFWPTPWGVPFTGQTFAVLLVGATLGARRGAAALTLHLFEGALGLPVFAHATPFLPLLSLGYIVGFIPAAWVVGRLAEKGWDRHILGTLAAMSLATLVILLSGTLWGYNLAKTLQPTLATGEALKPGLVEGYFFTPYLVGAAIKIALAALLLPTAWRIARR